MIIHCDYIAAFRDLNTDNYYVIPLIIFRSSRPLGDIDGCKLHKVLFEYYTYKKIGWDWILGRQRTKSSKVILKSLPVRTYLDNPIGNDSFALQNDLLIAINIYM